MAAVASLVANDIIDAARDRHPCFDARRHPRPALLRALSRYQRQLAAKIIRADPSLMVLAQETALPLADFDAGIALPDRKYPSGVEVEPGDVLGSLQKSTPVELVPWEERHRWHLGAYIRNNVLFLTGAAGDWVGFTKLRFFYVPEPDALANVTDVLVVPNAAEPCLVAHLAWVMAQRSVGDPTAAGLDPKPFFAEWMSAEDQLIDEIGGHDQATTSVIREAF